MSIPMHVTRTSSLGRANDFWPLTPRINIKNMDTTLIHKNYISVCFSIYKRYES